MSNIAVSNDYKENWSKVIWCEHFEKLVLKKGYLEHSHPIFEIVYYSKAKIKEFIKDISYDIRDGDLIFIDEYEAHRIIVDKEDTGSGYVIHFKKVFIEKFLILFNTESILTKVFKRENKVFNLNFRQRELVEIFMSLFFKTYERYSNNPYDPIIHASMVSQLFNLLVTALKYTPPDNRSLAVTKPKETVQKVIVYIDVKYTEPLNLTDISKHFNINKYYLSHVFKDYTGFTLFEYILHRRIIEAQKLLKDTALSIETIKLRCGFANLQYFYKAFKKIVKTSPVAYRNNRGRMI